MLNHLVDSDHNSNAMLSRYHLQPQQPQQQTATSSQHSINTNTKLQTNNNDTIINNNNINTTNNIIGSNSNNNHNNNNNNSIDQVDNKTPLITAANIVKNKVVSGNNYSHSNTKMQSNPSIQPQRKPGLPNPVTSSDRCCTFKIPPEERRYRDFELEQSKILKEIMQKTNTKIEVTTTKGGVLNFCIIGKEAILPVAKNLVLADFQIPVTLTLSVPKSIYGRLLANKGMRIANIQDETRTKIMIPRKDEDSDVVKIIGLKSNAELAMKALEKFAREIPDKAMEKVTVESIYALFITGPFNENLKKWDGLGAKVSTSRGVLPSTLDRQFNGTEQVTFTIQGDTNAVNQVKEEIIQIYEDKKKKCTTVNMEVKKAQHKYILGPGGQNLRQLFAKTGVSVELPHESESETITLRGERSKLGPALSELYAQAHSETDDYLEVESWLQKYLIGPRRTNNIDFKACGVEVKSSDDKIKLHGPPTEVENIKEIFESELANLRKTMISKDIRVESRLHGYIIGRSGATVDQIREESGAHILVPKNDESNEYITLQGTQEAIAKAEEKINAIAKKYEASRKLTVDQHLLRFIIGRGGEKIKSIREKFANVVFIFPDQKSKSNEISILGPKDEVDECYQYLDEFHKQLQESNYQGQVPIKKDIVKYLSDAESAIRKIKSDHKVKVDIYINKDVSDGKSEQPAQASQQQNKTNKPPTEQAISDADNSDAKKKTKGKNKGQKQELNEAQQDVSKNEPKANGVAQRNVESTIGPGDSHAVVLGKKEDVDQAKAKLVELFQDIATTIEVEVKMPHKSRSFFGPNSLQFRALLDEFHHKIAISFPKQSQQQQSEKQSPVGEDTANQNTTTNGVSSAKSNNVKPTPRIDIVKIRGPKSIVKKAEKRLMSILKAHQEKLDRSHSITVSVESATFDKFKGSDKVRLAKIRESHSVKLTIPDARDAPQIQASIVGYEKDLRAAAQELTDLFKEVKERTEETIEVPSQVHPRLIGAGGKAVKKLTEDFNVGVKFARQGDPNPDSVTLTGSPENIAKAKIQMLGAAEKFMALGSRAQVNAKIAPVSLTNNSQMVSEAAKTSVATD